MSRSVRDQVDRYLEWSRYAGNEFLTKKLQKARMRFEKELRTLREYLMVHVFSFRGTRSISSSVLTSGTILPALRNATISMRGLRSLIGKSRRVVRHTGRFGNL